MKKMYRVAYEDSEGERKLTNLTNLEDAKATARVLDGLVLPIPREWVK
tara:strand:+ start:446 stop:589 length:144 start_codon:yes stop_codon:yes gene_type:complete